jgi:hypothetical protein
MIFPGQFFILKHGFTISSTEQMQIRDFCTFDIGVCGIVVTMSSIEMRAKQHICCVLINNCLYYPAIWVLEECI